MEKLKDMYDFKMFLDMGVERLLTFRAWVVDEKTYYIQEVPHFEVNESDKQIFLSILEGTLEVNEYEIVDNEVTIHERKPDVGDDICSRFRSVATFLEQVHGIETTFEPIALQSMLRFRYDGPELNIGYGLDPKIAGKIYRVSDELMKAIAVNNTSFEGVHQVGAQAGSTIIPYISEIVDMEALVILERAMNDINRKSVDVAFSESDDRYAKLYKSFIRKLETVKSIPGIEVFELITGNNTEGIKIDDISLISHANRGLYHREVSHMGIVHMPAVVLRNNPGKYTAKVIIDDYSTSIHLAVEDPNFEHMKRMLLENWNQKVVIFGYTSGEATILATSIRKYYEPEDN